MDLNNVLNGTWTTDLVQYQPQAGQHIALPPQAGQQQQYVTAGQIRDAENLGRLELLQHMLMGQPVRAFAPEGRQQFLNQCLEVLQPVLHANIQAERWQHARLQLAHQQLLMRTAQQRQGQGAPAQDAESMTPSASKKRSAASDFATLRRNDPAAAGIAPLMGIRGRPTATATNGLKRRAPDDDNTLEPSTKSQKTAETIVPAPMVDTADAQGIMTPSPDKLLSREISNSLSSSTGNSARMTPNASQELHPVDDELEWGLVNWSSDP